VFLGTRLGRSRGDAGVAKVAEEEAEKIRLAAKAEVDALKQAAEVQGKEAARKRKAELDDELKQRKAELHKREESIAQKERELDRQRKDAERRAGELDKKEKSVDGKVKQADAAVEKAESAQAEARKKLEQIAGLSEEAARKKLEEEVRSQALASAAVEIKQAKDEESKADILVFECKGNLGQERAAHGLTRALVGNMLKGVTDGFTRELEIKGVGYKAEIKGQSITLLLGFSHPVEYKLPEGVSAKVDKNMLILTGIDKEKLGGVAAEIRAYRPPEPYKGKGVRYADERVVIKETKKK
jgi:large subunit ribosomal protein L6